MPRAEQHPIRVLVRGIDPGLARLAIVAVAHAAERVGLTVAALFLSAEGARLAVPAALALGGLFLVRAALRSAFRLRTRGRALQAVAAALLTDVHTSQDAAADTEASLIDGLQAAEDILSLRVPEILGDVPACVACAVLVVVTQPHEIVLEGAAGIAIGALGVLAVRRATAASAQRVWDAFMPAMDDLMTAIYGRLEIAGNGDEASFLRGLAERLKKWEATSAAAAKVSVFAGRAPAVAAGAVIGLLLIRRGGLHDSQLASAAVIASVTPAFLGAARGILDLGRDLVRAAPVVSCLQAAQRRDVQGVVSADVGAAVAWENVAFSYPGQAVPTLHDVNVTWLPTELLAVAGPNGSGKSTFVRLLLGLDAPTQGRVTIGGEPLVYVDGAEFRQKIGYLAQRSFLPDRMTVLEAVRLLAPEADLSAITEMLTRLAVWPVLTRRSASGPLNVRLGTLSAGEKQRVAIARVLLRDAKMVILDEPDANLDAEGIALVSDILTTEGRKRMVAFVAHDPVLLARADRVLQFESGRIRMAE